MFWYLFDLNFQSIIKFGEESESVNQYPTPSMTVFGVVLM